MSLDVFRGMTVAAMVLVNDPGTWSAIYSPLEHAEWNGWTHTDLVFPFFLFIVGVSMAFSFSAREKKGAKKNKLLQHTLIRAAIIYGIGFFLVMFPYFTLEKLQHVRIMGVLARIAVCYAFAGTIYLYVNGKQRVGIILAALIGYWAAMTFIPVPGYGAGNLTPDGNLAAFIDRKLMLGHLWKPTWDPEGLLSTIPAIATTLIGTFVGEWLMVKTTWQNKLKLLIAAGVVGLIVGEALDYVFPINKSLWTSSYVIFTAGYAMLVLATCYFIIDVKQWRTWCPPFLVFGMNAILAFTLSTFLAKNLLIYKMMLPSGKVGSAWTWVYLHWFAPLASDPRNSSLMFALAYVGVLMAVMWGFYCKKIFIKV